MKIYVVTCTQSYWEDADFAVLKAFSDQKQAEICASAIDPSCDCYQLPTRYRKGVPTISERNRGYHEVIEIDLVE